MSFPGFWGDALLTKREEVTLLPLAARTADVTTPAVDAQDYVGVLLVIRVTALAATPSVVTTFEFRDPVDTTQWVRTTAGIFTAFTAIGNHLYLLHPAAANNIYTETKQSVLPQHWRLFMDHADADSITYSVGAVLLR